MNPQSVPRTQPWVHQRPADNIGFKKDLLPLPLYREQRIAVFDVETSLLRGSLFSIVLCIYLE